MLNGEKKDTSMRNYISIEILLCLNDAEIRLIDFVLENNSKNIKFIIIVELNKTYRILNIIEQIEI